MGWLIVACDAGHFVGSKVAALPPMVKLDTSTGISVPEQLNVILNEHSVKLIDLFREWDEDGNGAIDKKEFRAAIAGLGYDVSKKEANAAFDLLDDSGDGFIEYDEFKKQLAKYKPGSKAAADASKALAKQQAKKEAKNAEPDAAPASGAGEDTDVVGTGEEEFDVGMKQNAMERDAADKDQDGKLDLQEFMELVRERDEAEHTDEELAERFKALDEDASGKIDMPEFLMWSLRDALQRCTERVCDLFKKWDEDNSGKIDKREFCHAVRALGFRESIQPASRVMRAGPVAFHPFRTSSGLSRAACNLPISLMIVRWR